jgi:two-component system cell cycle response regulator DivK
LLLRACATGGWRWNKRRHSRRMIIIDIQLPHVSGIDLIEAMQKDAALSAIPVLAVKAYAGNP